MLLYDFTSTYFEIDPPLSDCDKRQHGCSRDYRPNCVQVMIALVVSSQGFPLAYEFNRRKLREVLSRGAWPFAFVLQVAAALGETKLELGRLTAPAPAPDPPNRRRRSDAVLLSPSEGRTHASTPPPLAPVYLPDRVATGVQHGAASSLQVIDSGRKWLGRRQRPIVGHEIQNHVDNVRPDFDIARARPHGEHGGGLFRWGPDLFG